MNTPQSFGAVGDGVADDTIALNAMFQSAHMGSEIEIPHGIYRITNTVKVLNKRGIRCRGLTGPIQPGSVLSAVTIKWDGSSDGIPLQIDGSRDCEFERFEIRAFTGKSFQVGIDCDTIQGGSEWGANTNNIFRHIGIQVPADKIGIRLSFTSTTNVDLYTFEHCTIGGEDSNLLCYAGYQLASFNTHHHRIVAGTIKNAKIGIDCVKGFFHAYHVNLSRLDIFLKMTNSAHPIKISGCNAEMVTQIFKNFQSSNGQNITFEQCRLGRPGAYTMPAIDYQARGVLMLIGNSFSISQDQLDFKIKVSNSSASRIVSFGNTYPSTSPFDTQSGGFPARIISYGDTYYNSASNVAPFNDIIE